MITLMNQYLSNIILNSDDMMTNLLKAAVINCDLVQMINVTVRNNKYIVDIKLKDFSVENVTSTMNIFMEQTRYPYSSYYVRFNEGKQVRYRYGSCKEDKQGFYCDVVFS